VGEKKLAILDMTYSGSLVIRFVFPETMESLVTTKAGMLDFEASSQYFLSLINAR
jgi:hypothetical protein